MLKDKGMNKLKRYDLYINDTIRLHFELNDECQMI